MFIATHWVNTVASIPGGRAFPQGFAMNLLILGVGNMGSAFARQFAKAGHAVQLAATSIEKAQQVAATSLAPPRLTR